MTTIDVLEALFAATGTYGDIDPLGVCIVAALMVSQNQTTYCAIRLGVSPASPADRLRLPLSAAVALPGS